MSEARKSLPALSASAVGQTFVPACPESASPARRLISALIAAPIAAAMLMTGESAPHAHTRTTQVTWTAGVEAIVAARCVRCHQPAGFGPMSLATYADAKMWA